MCRCTYYMYVRGDGDMRKWSRKRDEVINWPLAQLIDVSWGVQWAQICVFEIRGIQLWSRVDDGFVYYLRRLETTCLLVLCLESILNLSALGNFRWNFVNFRLDFPIDVFLDSSTVSELSLTYICCILNDFEINIKCVMHAHHIIALLRKKLYV